MTTPTSPASPSSGSKAPAIIINEEKPAIIKAAARGDLETVRRIVETAAAISIAEKNKVMNQAPIWTEVLPVVEPSTAVIEETGGISNVVTNNNVVSNENSNSTGDNNLTSQHWFDVTAITMAATRGHHQVLQYLLEEGADPTLKGCPKDAIQNNDDDDLIVADQKELHMNVFDVAKELYKKIRCCRRSHDLIMICKPYWRRCYYSSSNASRCKRETFTNAPLCELSYLKDNVISRVPPLSQYPLKSDYYDEPLIDVMPSTSYPIVGQKRTAGMIDHHHHHHQQQQESVYVGGRLRRCFVCNEAKSEAAFSRNQRKKGPEAACISCVATAGIQIASELKERQTSLMTAGEEKGNEKGGRPSLPQDQLISSTTLAQNNIAPSPRQGDIAARDYQQRLDEGY
jgi:hypothetical protein